ncbi:MAG: hypothetical protein U5Q16_02225 [Gammaproteobacteria bacterium]|nr:hypothetical protein [Gammaproteobacteria bacterium]
MSRARALEQMSLADPAGERVDVPVTGIRADHVDVVQQYQGRFIAARQACPQIAPAGRRLRCLVLDAGGVEDAGQISDAVGLVARRIGGVDADVFGETLRRLFGEFRPALLGAVDGGAEQRAQHSGVDPDHGFLLGAGSVPRAAQGVRVRVAAEPPSLRADPAPGPPPAD